MPGTEIVISTTPIRIQANEHFHGKKALSVLKSIVEEKTNEKFNSCLLNLYHKGDEGMAYHSDGEKELKKNGSLLIMKDKTRNY